MKTFEELLEQQLKLEEVGLIFSEFSCYMIVLNYVLFLSSNTVKF